jgi:hypothetical protein
MGERRSTAQKNPDALEREGALWANRFPNRGTSRPRNPTAHRDDRKPNSGRTDALPDNPKMRMTPNNKRSEGRTNE